MLSRVPHPQRWSLVATTILAVGIGISVTSSILWATNVQGRAIRSFDAEANSLGLTITSALRGMNDLTQAARTLVATTPDLTNRQLAAWYQGMGGPAHRSGVVGFAYVELVPASALTHYAKVIEADPAPGQPIQPGHFRVTPPGHRGHYCFIRLAASSALSVLASVGAGLDFCAVPGAELLFGSPSAPVGGAVTARLAGSGEAVIVSAPIYRVSVAPASGLHRRHLLMGWIIGAFDLSSILHRVIIGAPALDVTISWRRPGAGTLPNHVPRLGRLTALIHLGQASSQDSIRRTFKLAAGKRWVVSVARTPDSGALSASAQGYVVLGSGLALTVLVFSLIRILSRGRQRALAIVEEKTRALRHQALHDPLTGLPNRALVLERVASLLSRGRQTPFVPAALFIDLDDFKNINDTFGHAAGDAVLQAVGQRLLADIRVGETVGRLGGDEFVVLVEATTATAVEIVAQRLLDGLCKPFAFDATSGPQKLSLTASVGLATGDRTSADELLRDADIALYAAKGAGKHRYAVFEPAMGDQVHSRMQLEMDLQFALEREELFLEYQPIYDLTRNRVTGAEALLRWRHPSLGVIPPTSFVPIAESSGLIRPIRAWVLQTACREAQTWRTAGFDLDVAVNVSPIGLSDPTFPGTLTAALLDSGLRPSALILELTESVLMPDPISTARLLRKTKALGVRIAIDDFGTGQSSLACLRQLPVDRVKIDRGFIAPLGSSAEARAVITTLVELGEALDLEIVAEGVEDQEQLARVRAVGCGLAQGFLLARPLAPEAFRTLIEQDRLPTAGTAGQLTTVASIADRARNPSARAV